MLLCILLNVKNKVTIQFRIPLIKYFICCFTFFEHLSILTIQSLFVLFDSITVTSTIETLFKMIYKGWRQTTDIFLVTYTLSRVACAAECGSYASCVGFNFIKFSSANHTWHRCHLLKGTDDCNGVVVDTDASLYSNI